MLKFRMGPLSNSDTASLFLNILYTIVPSAAGGIVVDLAGIIARFVRPARCARLGYSPSGTIKPRDSLLSSRT